MCLALPVRVIELKADDMAVVDAGGVRKEISVALVEGNSAAATPTPSPATASPTCCPAASA